MRKQKKFATKFTREIFAICPLCDSKDLNDYKLFNVKDLQGRSNFLQYLLYKGNVL